jgi:4-amino-4-deoxy-L-arabinose transferase-like glycosyltransferase
MSIITKSGENKASRFSKSWLFLLSIILFVVFVRVRLLDFPLERDEGEYAYMGQLILQGVPPYSEAYNMKFPGTYLMYALIMAIFGQTVQGIHIGLMIVNCATILLVYLLARKMVDDFPAAVAGGIYGVLSLSSSVFGFAAHATHFVVLPAMGGTLLLLHALEKEKPRLYFLSGTLLGISIIMKQPGIFFVLFGVTYILWQHVYSKLSGLQANKLAGLPAYQLGAFSMGASLPLIVTFLWLYAAGVFDRFWFWTVVYASKYAAQIPVSQAFLIFAGNFPSVIDGFFLFWILAACGFIVLFFHRRLRVNKSLILLFTLFSFLSICLGFYFRGHYFVTLLPAVAILSGIFIDFLSSRGFTFLKSSLSKYIGAGIFTAAALIGITGHREYFFKGDPVKLSRSIYGTNPFPECIEIAKFIEARSTVNDTVAVFGSEPQIFFYAKRHSSSGYIYMYSLMETHEYVLPMQKEMIAEVEASKPKFIVDVRSPMSWLQHWESEIYIFQWFENYITDNYNLVGVVDIISSDMTNYKWYGDVNNYMVQSPSYVLIYERR